MQNKNHKKLILFWCILLLTSFHIIQGQIILTGKVLNKNNNQPVPYASVQVKSFGSGAMTNAQGYFNIKVPIDTSTLFVSCVGYKKVSTKLIPPFGSSLVIIYIEEDIKQIDEVTVVTERERIARITDEISTVKISPKLVSKLPSMGEVDVVRSFQLLPGISATNETSAGLYVRGGTPDQNLILFDGMTIYHVDHFYGFFSAFNANTIDDIKLIKGGFPAQYGNRLSSVMEITGKPADMEKVNGTAMISLLSVKGAIEVPLVKEKVSLQLAARRSYTDIIKTGLYNKIFNLYNDDNQSSQIPSGGRMGMMQFQEQEPDFYFYDINAKLTYNISIKHTFAISFYNGKDELDNSREDLGFGFMGPGGATSGTEGSTSTTDIAGWGNTGISGQWKSKWSDKFNSTLFLSGSKYFSKRDQHSNSSETSENNMRDRNTLEDNAVNDISFRWNNQLRLPLKNTLSFGFENTINNINYSLTFNDTLNLLNKNMHGVLSAIYIQNQIQLLNNKLDITLGFRGTYQDLTEKLFYEPRAAVKLEPVKGFKLKAAWGVYNQFCTRIIREDVLQGSKDFWLLIDGDSIPVSSANHYITGISFEKGDYLMDIEAYYKNMDGLTEYSFRNTNMGRIDNQQQDYFFKGSGYAKGIEFMLQKKYGLNTGWIAYTLSEVKYTYPDLNYGNPFYASHDQTHELKTVYCRKIKNWDISATFVYATGKPYTAPMSQYQITLLDGSEYSFIHISDKNSLRLPDYHKLDLAVSYNWYGKLSDKTLSFSVFNVYNHTNIWYKEYSIEENQMNVTNVNYLGFTPNISFSINFK